MQKDKNMHCLGSGSGDMNEAEEYGDKDKNEGSWCIPHFF